MKKNSFLITFIIIFILITVLGSIFEKQTDIHALDGVRYYGIPFTYWSINSFTNDINIINLQFLTLDFISWGLLSFLITKIIFIISRRK